MLMPLTSRRLQRGTTDLSTIGVVMINRLGLMVFVISLAAAPAALAQDAQPSAAFASISSSSLQQSNLPQGAQDLEQDVEDAVRRFRVGVTGGVGLDPELIMVGFHGRFGPLFRPGIEFRPGVELGVGELTTMFGIDLDVL